IAKGDAPLASFLPYLSRSKDRVGGSGGRSAPVGRAGRSPATSPSRRDYQFPPARDSGQKPAGGPQARTAEGRRSRPPPSSAEDHRYPPARGSFGESGESGPQKGPPASGQEGRGTATGAKSVTAPLHSS